MTRRLLRFLAGIMVLSGLTLAAIGIIVWAALNLPGWLALAFLLLLAGASVSAALEESK